MYIKKRTNHVILPEQGPRLIRKASLVPVRGGGWEELIGVSHWQWRSHHTEMGSLKLLSAGGPVNTQTAYSSAQVSLDKGR